MSKKFAVMLSGNGSNLQAMIDGGFAPVAVLSNKENAYGLERASVAGIPAYVIDPKDDQQILDILKSSGAEFLFLAGYLQKISPAIINHLPIYNIHPATDLHRFGGKGMYGIKVHEAIIAEKEPYTGATIHRVDENYDEGAIIMQTPPVVVEPEDTAQSLASKVLAEEHKLVLRFLSEV